MAEITMPRLSDTMSEGTVGRWLKKPGDQVQSGDIVAEIETDKATMELEAFESGTLQKILVEEGQTVPIGQPIAIIGDGAAPAESAPAESTPAPAAAEKAAEASTETQAPTESAPAAPQATATAPQATTDDEGDRLKASPVARRLAQEYGVDLRQVQGTGPGGRILKENVEAARGKQAAPAPAAQPAAAPAPQAAAPAPAAPAPSAPVPAGAEITPMSRMRRAIARAMTESKPGIPHIYVTAEIDMGEAMKLRQQINDSGASPVKISVNDFVVKATAKALSKFPAVNSSYAVGQDGQPGILAHPQINVSVAVATDNGLSAPVVRDADKKSISTISAEIRELAGRAREGKSKQSDLEGATFQTSNLGMFDVVEFASIVSVPQAGSLSIGAVRQVPVVRNGEIVVGQIMNVTISVDHRVADGAVAAQFLQELTRLLQSPMSLLV